MLRESRRPTNPYLDYEEDIYLIDLSTPKSTALNTTTLDFDQLNPLLAQRLIALTGNKKLNI